MSYFVDTLFRTTIAIPVEPYSYALHLEVLNTLLSLLYHVDGPNALYNCIIMIKAAL